MNTELIEELENLLKKQTLVEELSEKINAEENQLMYLQSINAYALEEFDRKHKESYISSHAGEAPREPLLFGHAKWEQDYREWQKRRSYYEEEYYKYYQSERKELDMNTIYEKRRIVSEKIHELKDEYQSALKKALESDVSFGPDLQSSTNISTIISFLRSHRADTLKEAVNLLSTEFHHQRVEKSINDINNRIDSLEKCIKSDKDEVEEELEELRKSLKETDDWVDELDDRVDNLDSRVNDLENDDECDENED